MKKSFFVANPDSYSLPSYRISPFTTSYVSRYALLEKSTVILDYFDNRFGKNNWLLTKNGREAIRFALSSFNLKHEDTVSILTPSDNFYISGCVTNSISDFCQWNRTLTPNTKLIFINHEFGYPYKKMDELIATGKPIIEDCCTTFFSQDKAEQLGHYGDFSVYSFPKFFPIQIGGLLVGKNVANLSVSSELSFEEKQYLINALSIEIQNSEAMLARRDIIQESLTKRFEKFGFKLRFAAEAGIFPSVFLFTSANPAINWNAMKTHFWNHGIQSSVFYGEPAFFIPTHQNLTETDLDYFEFVMYNFLKWNTNSKTQEIS